MKIKISERSTAMNYSVRVLLLSLIMLAMLVGTGVAQYGSSEHYNLQLKFIKSGGNEGDEGVEVPSGHYFLRLYWDEEVILKHATVLR